MNNKPCLTNKYVKNYIESYGYKLLDKYIKNIIPIKLKCPENHIYTARWNDFQQGKRCRICAFKKLAEDRKHSYFFIKSEFEKRGWKLISKNYINNRTKLKVLCSEGHECKIAYDKFKSGRGCPICKSINQSGEKHWAWKGGIANEPYCDVWTDESYKKSIKKRDNYKCQNEYCWKTAKRLNVHHIDYDKNNCNPKNLITVCNSCNSRANFNRRFWGMYYKRRIKIKYEIF